MRDVDISGLSADEVRDRPCWCCDPWVGVIAYAVTLPLFGWILWRRQQAGDAVWVSDPYMLALAAALGLAAGCFFLYAEYRMGVKAQALEMALLPPPDDRIDLSRFALPIGLVALYALGYASKSLGGQQLAGEPLMGAYLAAWWLAPLPFLGMRIKAYGLAWQIIREVKSRGRAGNR